VVEVEVKGNGIALRGNHVNGGGAGDKVFGGEIELESGAGEGAAAVLGAQEIGLTVRREGFELLVIAGDLHVEIFPEVIRTRGEASGRTGARTGGANDIRAVGIGELDLHYDSYEFALVAMIESSLLSAITGRVLAGFLDEKSERSKEGDGGDVRAGFRRREEFCVFIEKSGHGFVTPLAEEISFANGLVGQGSVEGEGGRRQQQGRSKNREA
jgi:hypothetical protein